MRIINRTLRSRKTNANNIPNVMAFTFIRNWLSDSRYKEEREQYFIGNLSSQQINLTMKEIKWLARTYKDLDIISVEDAKGKITQVIL
ncbi:MAG: hypothetical protein ACRCX2_15460 [Paraclostridium sp.]